MQSADASALDAQLCTLLLNSQRLSTHDMLTSIAVKAGGPATLASHLTEVLNTLLGQATNLRSLLSDSGISLAVLARTAQDTHCLLAERIDDPGLKQRLDEACFMVLEPAAHRRILATIDYPNAQRWLTGVLAKLRNEVGVPVLIAECRVKSAPSAWKKSGHDLTKLAALHDLYATRFVVPTEQDCYAAISNLLASHDFDAFHYRDYVAKAKASGYSSLHIVITEGPHRVEVQVRTEHMHQVAQHGSAAHWAYKTGGRSEPAWLSQVLAGAELPERIRVYTPAGQVAMLPQGACVIDFAYWVHSDVGRTTVGASINGQGVSLNALLSDGDSVQVRVGKRNGPNKDWLSWVAGTRVKGTIRRQLRSLEEQSPAPVVPVERRPAKKHLPGTPPAPPVELDGSSAETIRVIGGEGIPYRIAQCCRPNKG
ncbi:MAG: TGS domain-containing protein, partial [Actinomycetes bacterium]